MSGVRYPAKNWTLYCCILCGEPYPLGPEWHANMSGTSHRAQLPCPCTTRRPPDPPEIELPNVLETKLEDWTPEQRAEFERRLERFKADFDIGRREVDDP